MVRSFFRCFPTNRGEVKRADGRKVLNGIYWRLRTGSPWADIPERYGPSTACHNRFVRWRKIGVWDAIFAAVSQAYDGHLQMVVSSSIRVHQHAANDGRSAAGMLNSVAAGQTLIADRAYDSDTLRHMLANRGAWANVKPMPGRINLPPFSPYLYRFRNLVERFFNKLKHFRAVATRFEKHDANYLALVKLAATRTWMRFMSR
jgi:transposase